MKKLILKYRSSLVVTVTLVCLGLLILLVNSGNPNLETGFGGVNKNKPLSFPVSFSLPQEAQERVTQLTLEIITDKGNKSIKEYRNKAVDDAIKRGMYDQDIRDNFVSPFDTSTDNKMKYDTPISIWYEDSEAKIMIVFDAYLGTPVIADMKIVRSVVETIYKEISEGRIYSYELFDVMTSLDKIGNYVFLVQGENVNESTEGVDNIEFLLNTEVVEGGIKVNPYYF